MPLEKTKVTGNSAIVAWLQIKSENRLLYNILRTGDLKIPYDNKLVSVLLDISKDDRNLVHK